MISCRILVKGNYADWEGSGTNRKARYHDVGDIVRFPEIYAAFLSKQGMIEVLADIPLVEEIPLELEVSILPAEKNDTPAKASESALELAASNNVNLNNIVGTGSEGRILLADVRAYMLDQQSKK